MAEEVPTENGVYILTGGDWLDRMVIVIDGAYLSPNIFEPSELTDLTDEIEVMLNDGVSKMVPMKVRC